jgi:energy-coupling factor transporter ATP-binding protein EcfA2
MSSTKDDVTDIYRVVSVSPDLIQIEVLDVDRFKVKKDQQFSIGSYLRISDHNSLSVIAIVQSYKIKDPTTTNSDTSKTSFIVDAQPVGVFDEKGMFKRGGQQIAIPPSVVELADSEHLKKIYDTIDPDKRFVFGNLSQDERIEAALDGDKFFAKHIAVVGSTGSGKSCTVAKILQEAIKPSEGQKAKGALNNSHIVIFDIHGEYGAAFPNANKITISNLVLPYWLMNSEELEELFIESNEQNSHNQMSQFKLAVIENKKRHNPGLVKLTYDTPVYFDINEVYRFIWNQNYATKDAKTGEIKIKDKKAGVEDKWQFFEEIKFEEKATGKVNGGPYSDEFHRFLSRLETKLQDERLGFFLKPRKSDSTEYRTEDLGDILKQFLGYVDSKTANVTVIDLSGIPFEVLSIVVSLITRLIFDFSFNLKRSKSTKDEAPILLVYEEAHNYVPNNGAAKYASVRRSIERVAKEGRKYGLSLMIVSQRPSEISDTIFSQCNNFVAMRLTNPADQHYVQRLLPDAISAITDSLPVLEKREALLIGDAVSVPTLLKVGEPQHKPDSADIQFQLEWKKDWLGLDFDSVLKRLRKSG